MQSALNFSWTLCGVTFSSRKVALETVKHCLLLRTIPVLSCSEALLDGCMCLGLLLQAGGFSVFILCFILSMV